MAAIIFSFFIATFIANSGCVVARKPQISSQISVVGGVYCDTCSTKSLSNHSYFLPGVEVQIGCKFKANLRRTSEKMDFTVNRTTDKHGIYRLEIANIDGTIDCSNSGKIAILCQATILKNSNSACKIPQIKTTTDRITAQLKQDNHCIYNLNALSYKPRTINASLCIENGEMEKKSFLNSSKCFFPFFPPFSYPQSPPSLPFPFPLLPPATAIFPPPPPPALALDLRDPRTWIRYYFPPSPPNRP